MMDKGYFVPRGEILSWINNLLNVRNKLFSSIYQKSSNWDQGQSIAKS